MSARAPARTRSPFAWAQSMPRSACFEPLPASGRLVFDGTVDAWRSTMNRSVGIDLGTTNSVVDAELKGASP